jgi:iron complex transport system substrate-binding protein
MSRILLLLILSLLSLSTLLSSCTSATTSVSQTNTPPKANLTQSANRANRIVALTSVSADILRQLDSKKLVGMSGSNLFAKDPNFANVPTVSTGRTPPQLEKIVALKPDLVIGAVGFHDQALKKMQELNIPTIATEINSWSDLESLTQKIADATETDAAPLLKRYQACLANIPPSSRSTLVLVSRQPLLAPNRQSWAGSLLEQFKAKNVAAELQGKSGFRGYITLSPEKVLEANPEVLILVDPEKGDISEFKTLPFWDQLQAVKNDRVYAFEYYGLINPGSIAKIEQACDRLKQVLAPKS